MPRRSEDCAEGKKKKEMEIAAATETRARDKRRDETRRDKQARRGDATLLPSRFLKLEVSKSRTPNRGPHLGDPKTIGTSYFSFYQFLKKCIFEILLYLLKSFFFFFVGLRDFCDDVNFNTFGNM
jgi:hypothetical protein